MPDRGVGGWRRLGALLVATAAVVGSLAGCASTGAAHAPSPARIERLGALFVQAVPVGWMVERVAERDAQWPFQQHAGKFTPAQLACTRGELTADKASATQLADAREFARRHPDRVEESIQLLESGAAEATGVLMRAGVREATGGAPTDPRSVMREMSAAQLRSFVSLTEASQHAELRQAMRLDGIAGAGSRQASRQQGYRVGQSLMMGPLLTALERCRIPPASLFDKAGTPA